MSAGSDDLWNEAMALLLAWQADPGDQRARDAIESFCAQGPRHREAWEEAKRVYRFTGEAVGARVPGRRRQANRRQVLGGLAAVAATGTAAALFGPTAWRRWRADITTGVAEIRRLQLPEGSWLTLGAESAVRLSFGDHERRLDILDGTALCEVAGDVRPFEARADTLRAVTQGATLELRQNGGRSFVGVGDGFVEVATVLQTEAMLQRGDWLALGPGTDDLEYGTRDPAETAAWRRRLLVVERDPVGAVVAEIARWRHGEVFIADPALARAPVSGLYDLADPDAALAAVVAPYGGRVRHISRWIVVLSRV